MTRWFRSLRAKLLVGHLVVIVVGAVTLMFVTRFTGPRLFELHVAAMGGHVPPGGRMGSLPAAMNVALSDALQQSLTQALLVGGLAALVAGVVVSVVITRQVIGPVQLLAAAAGHVAAGRYGERVPESDTTELALLTHSFNEMAEALEAGEQRRVRLIGDVAHELRTPMSTLEGYLEGLADGVEEPSEELWVLLREETGRMRRLVEDMHELSRADAGQLLLTLARVTPDAIVEPALARLAPDFAAKGLHLRNRAPAGLPAVLADRDRAIQVLTNLLTNALRYTPAGGEVELSAAVEGDAVRFAVGDTGEGIGSEHLPHVFERFYRVDASRSRAMGGSGVGLTIAQALVESMGGTIQATSPGLGQGATFSFTLPLA